MMLAGRIARTKNRPMSTPTVQKRPDLSICGLLLISGRGPYQMCTDRGRTPSLKHCPKFLQKAVEESFDKLRTNEFQRARSFVEPQDDNGLAQGQRIDPSKDSG